MQQKHLLYFALITTFYNLLFLNLYDILFEGSKNGIESII